jgi:hypothetical protein
MPSGPLSRTRPAGQRQEFDVRPRDQHPGACSIPRREEQKGQLLNLPPGMADMITLPEEDAFGTFGPVRP